MLRYRCGTAYVSRMGVGVKRGEVPGEGRSGGEGRAAITPPPPIPFTSLRSMDFPGLGGQNLRNDIPGGAPDFTKSRSTTFFCKLEGKFPSEMQKNTCPDFHVNLLKMEGERRFPRCSGFRGIPFGLTIRSRDHQFICLRGHHIFAKWTAYSKPKRDSVISTELAKP